MLGFYKRIISIQMKKNLLINLFIIIQIAAVFAISIITISAVKNEMTYYNAVKPAISDDGVICGGYFLDDEEESGLYSSTEKLKSSLKNVELISSIDFTSLQTGQNEETGEILTAYTLIYDDYSANLYRPNVKEGKWITETAMENSSDHIMAVVTKNNYGWKVGDIVTLTGLENDVTIEVIGIIDDNEKYLCANTNFETYRPSYNFMFSSHFSSLNDELINRGFTDEEIKNEIKTLGYTTDIVYNQPVFFIIESEWKKTEEPKIMSDLLYIKYNKNITEQEKLYNRKYINENLNEISFVLKMSDINYNSKNEIHSEILTFAPIMVVVFLLSIVGVVCINAINCRNQMRIYSIFYLNGAEKTNILKITAIANTFLVLLALIICIVAFVVLNILGVLSKVVISFSMSEFLLIVLESGFFVLISVMIMTIMIRKNKFSKEIKEKKTY